ncbi:hypothetical protein FA13DRAFT_1085057 [Coprinellus micaceus]|uniref:Uncharacterized protein n=1 Tax=Coprinellus micaceus TaxID=71717 RepID=A0A4Y7TRI0_COPMI|nr:hypothetical protein FA13DRAFT_1085057 [Coprinellus micaceus]
MCIGLSSQCPLHQMHILPKPKGTFEFVVHPPTGPIGRHTCLRNLPSLLIITTGSDPMIQTQVLARNRLWSTLSTWACMGTTRISGIFKLWIILCQREGLFSSHRHRCSPPGPLFLSALLPLLTSSSSLDTSLSHRKTNDGRFVRFVRKIPILRRVRTRRRTCGTYTALLRHSARPSHTGYRAAEQCVDAIRGLSRAFIKHISSCSCMHGWQDLGLNLIPRS